MAPENFKQKRSYGFQVKKLLDAKLLIVISVQALIVEVFRLRVSIWPAIDNIAPLKFLNQHWNAGVATDLYSSGAARSPRIISLYLMNSFAQIFNQNYFFSFVVLSVIIHLTITPLIIFTVVKKIKTQNSNVHIFFLAIIINLIISPPIAHLLEANGFFLENGRLGSTSANLSLLFLLIALNLPFKLSVPFFILSALIHPSFFIILVLLFVVPLLGPKNLMKLGIIAAITIFPVIIFLTRTHSDYIRELQAYIAIRTPHHFVLDIPLKFTSLIILMSILFTWIFLAIQKNKNYEVLLLIFGFALGIRLTTLNNIYGLSLMLALLVFLIIPRWKRILGIQQVIFYTLMILQYLWHTETGTLFAFFVPATRGIPLINLVLGIILIDWFFSNFHFIKLLSSHRQNSILILAGLMMISFSAKNGFINLNANLDNISLSYPKHNSTQIDFLAGQPVYVNKGVNTIGAREFGGLPIFVDGYVFWDDLNLYNVRYLEWTSANSDALNPTFPHLSKIELSNSDCVTYSKMYLCREKGDKGGFSD
jgi:hypothetical protein